MSAQLFLPQDQQALITDLARKLDVPALLWLSGYFAGVAQLRQPQPAANSAPLAQAAAAEAPGPLTIVYGSQTGNAKREAEALHAACTAQGLHCRLLRADRYPTRELKDERLLFIVMSTQGEGDPPDDAIGFVEFLTGRRAPKLPKLKFAVLGLGDSSYPAVCGISQRLDERLAELGAERLQPAGAADLDIETVAGPWRQAAVTLASERLRAAAPPAAGAAVPVSVPASAPAATRDHPVAAELLLNQPITGRGSDKDVRHLELTLQDSGLRYQPGDALGVWPVQDEALVARVIAALGLDPDTPVEQGGQTRSLAHWLRDHRELTVLTRPFLAAHAERGGDGRLLGWLQSKDTAALSSLMATHQLLDLLQAYPAEWDAASLVAALRPLTPRLYSIASSQALHEDEVHLTVAHVAYGDDEAPRWGAASHYLAQRPEGEAVRVFVEENERFRLPSDDARDIIMIGAGTGVAPYRAFVQERQARGAPGRNWLFFGNPHFRSDFLYQTEWQRALEDGSLHRIALAFSRDQADKVYVQHRLAEHGAEVYQWITDGAHVYVCGDAQHMARDVHRALLDIAREHAGLDEDGARQWLEALAADGRYARDVY